MARAYIAQGERCHVQRVFGALIDLQPLVWDEAGLVCAPWIAPQLAAAALASCPLPLVPTAAPPVVPDSPARLVAGWYRRSDLHVPAPRGLRELVQVAGEGFGPADHPTTALCLAAIDGLPAGAAIDVGCGSGLLAQAWVASGRGPALGIDADPHAVRQASASAAAAGRVAVPTFTVRHIETLDPAELADRIVLANLPPVAQAALQTRLTIPPLALVVSGTSRADARPMGEHARRLGMRPVRMLRRGRYVCQVWARR